jgi:hypothetical protein
VLAALQPLAARALGGGAAAALDAGAAQLAERLANSADC